MLLSMNACMSVGEPHSTSFFAVSLRTAVVFARSEHHGFKQRTASAHSSKIIFATLHPRRNAPPTG